VSVCRHQTRLSAALLDEPDRARNYFQQAIEASTKIRFRPEIALTRLELAELLLAHLPDEQAEAQTHLDFAIEEFRAMKMQPALQSALTHKGLLQRLKSTESRTCLSDTIRLSESRTRGNMAITRVGPKHQITIPREVFEALGLETGDILEVQVVEGGLHLVPQRLIPRDQAWFWTEEWQLKEREASQAIEQGDVSGPFETVEDLIRHLRDG